MEIYLSNKISLEDYILYGIPKDVFDKPNIKVESQDKKYKSILVFDDRKYNIWPITFFEIWNHKYLYDIPTNRVSMRTIWLTKWVIPIFNKCTINFQ